MPCKFVYPAKGHQRKKNCTEPEFMGGFCRQHQPPPTKVTVTKVTLSWAPVPEKGTTVNAYFKKACDDAATRIETICGNGINPGGTQFTGTKGNFQLHHSTQPHANNAIFYRWVDAHMLVYGVGGHTTDNKNYSLTWYDGTTVAVNLNTKKIGGKGTPKTD